MKILVTSAIRLNNEQIDELSKNNELIFVENEETISAERFDFKEIEGIICNFFFLNNSIEKFPNLNFIQLTSVGTERVPMEIIKRRGIRVYNIRTAYAGPMAEFALCGLLNIYKNTSSFIANQSNHVWEKDRGILELAGKKALILGYGNVGKCIAKRLNAFDVKVIGMRRSKTTEEYCEEIVTIDELDDIISDIDIFFMCLPQNDATYHVIDSKRLYNMKNSAAIINIARGHLIEEDALIKLLDAGKFLGVALDVFEHEPLPLTSKLWNYDNVYITPHNSFIGENIGKRVFDELMENLRELK